jgi:acetolactate synthase I/II/III large subunit
MTPTADVVVSFLRAAGVRTLTGVPGGGTNLDLVDACGRAGVPFVLTATETGAAIASIAQSEITGRPAACLTTLGPGVASVANGVACAYLERAPLIVFTDAPPRREFEHQRFDHRALLAPIVKWSAILDRGNAAEVMPLAIAHAMGDPRGPVHVDVSPASASAPTPATPPTADIDAACGLTDDVAARLAGARRPLILAGLHARDGTTPQSIRATCASHRVPAMVTYKAKGVVADSDPWFAGVFTNGALERPLLEAADLLIAIGLDRVELLPRPFPAAPPTVDLRPAHAPLVAEALGASSWTIDEVRQGVRRARAAICLPGDGLSPDRVVHVAAAAARGARVTVDAGAHMFPATLLWPVDAPGGMLISNGLSTMGFAVPAALGAALLDRSATSDDAAPRRRATGHVVALTGDGGLLMCAGELATLARERADVIVIVFNDASLSLIDVKQRQRQLTRAGVSIGCIDWRALAESVGVRGFAADDEPTLAGALDGALGAAGPSLIDVRVDPEGYPAVLKAVRG